MALLSQPLTAGALGARCAAAALPRARGPNPGISAQLGETEGSSVSVVSSSCREPFLIIPGGTAAEPIALERPSGPR